METKRNADEHAEGAILANRTPAHRNDEFPAGYSSAGCSPAVPASASPASAIILGLVPHAKDFAANGILSLVTVSQPRGSLQPVPRFSVENDTGFAMRGNKPTVRKAVTVATGFGSNEARLHHY